MRHLHDLPFSPSELVAQRDLLWDNILSAFGLILECMEEWFIEVGEANSVSAGDEEGRREGTRRVESS